MQQSLEVQAKAVRTLRTAPPSGLEEVSGTLSGRRRKGRSQVDLAYDILKSAGSPLHLSEIITRVHSSFGVTIDRESLASSLSKKVARKDRFRRTARNTFACLNS